MKTYPYQTPDGIIQLVEKHELDQLKAANAELIERLRERTESHLHASARDVQTIQKQSIMLEKLAAALKEIAWIKETGQRDYSWTGDTAFAALTAYESANFESVANPIDEVVQRMESVPVAQLRNLHTNSRTISDGVEAVRTSLISAAKGEQP